MTGSLNPTPAARLWQALRPDWTRTVLVRRVVAGGLVLLAGVAALRPGPTGDGIEVVVAAHDLRPGGALTADDLRLEKRVPATVPDGSLTDLAAVVGSTLAGPARGGEVLTDVRLLGSRLAEATAGPDARIVPIRLTDTRLVDLVRPGDVVDILAAPDSDPSSARIVAAGAVVVLVPPGQQAPAGGDDRIVLVALPARAAAAAAGAALAQRVTLVLH